MMARTATTISYQYLDIMVFIFMRFLLTRKDSKSYPNLGIFLE
jgi:hypothetical protein